MRVLRERAEQLKEKRAGYGAILDFYVQVRDAQDASRTSVQIDQVKVSLARRSSPSEAGLSLVAKEDFPVDIDSSADLFWLLCQIGKGANPHLAAQMGKISQALVDNKLDLKELVVGGGSQQEIERAATKHGLDRQVLSFLVRNSTRPSIEAGRELLRGEIDLRLWRKNFCPVCGSMPALSILKGEGGMRFSLCSYCGCEWRVDRLSCSICGTKEPGMLQYIYGEGEEAHRIDLCDACHHYIKTIDYRSLEGSDPFLEDIATLHLDIVAVQKGYTRVIPNLWTA
jgi:FdhE protein